MLPDDVLLVEDLSQTPSLPQEKHERQQLRIAASRGLDIIEFAPQWWPVCSLCNLMTYQAPNKHSLCCDGPIRVQGWAT